MQLFISHYTTILFYENLALKIKMTASYLVIQSLA
jgi:hypothetical protein